MFAVITGNVTAQREARVHLTVLASDRRTQQVETVLDTGFNGYLTLPSAIIRALRLRSIGARPVTLGDGSTTVLNVYRARLVWHNGERTVLILEADGDPLLRMALLYGSRVVLDVLADGMVMIDLLRNGR